MPVKLHYAEISGRLNVTKALKRTNQIVRTEKKVILDREYSLLTKLASCQTQYEVSVVPISLAVFTRYAYHEL
jgi:hypothetical protein